MTIIASRNDAVRLNRDDRSGHLGIDGFFIRLELATLGLGCVLLADDQDGTLRNA